MRSFLQMLMIILPLTGCIDLAVNDSKLKHRQHLSTAHYPPADINTMRGGLGGVFSKGMNHLENTLENTYGIPASSTVWFKGSALAKTLAERYQTHSPHPRIILVGHSFGANEQVSVARALNKQNIPVALLMTVDSIIPCTIPPNVSRAVNFYKPSYLHLFSGQKISAENPRLTEIINIDVGALKGVAVNHFTIDSHPVIQRKMQAEVMRALRLGAL